VSRRTRALGRYRLKSYASVQEPRQYAVLVTHRDTGDRWMLALYVDGLDACNATLDKLTLAEIEQWTSTIKPLQFPKGTAS
jgi:hypothetical protein